jgi:hypothetical protein
MAAFMPGESPPEVSTPMVWMFLSMGYRIYSYKNKKKTVNYSAST